MSCLCAEEVLIPRLSRNVVHAREHDGFKFIRRRQIAKANGHLRGRRPKLSVAQQRHLLEVHGAGTHSVAELAELFGIGRADVVARFEPLECADGDAAGFRESLLGPSSLRAELEDSCLAHVCRDFICRIVRTSCWG